MSKVTIKELYWELNNEESCEVTKLWDDAKDIEIVPRKMVEMIIERCKEIQNDNYHDDEPIECGQWCAADEIKEYAESLLNQFEEK